MNLTVHKPHPNKIGYAACGLIVLNSTSHRLQIKDQEITCVNCASIYTTPGANNMHEDFECPAEKQLEMLKKENERLKLFIAEQAHYISLAIDH